MKIQIQPISIFTPSGPQNAVWFEVRYTNYIPGSGATSDCHLWTENIPAVEGVPATETDPEIIAVEGVPSIEIGASVVTSTQTQCDEWSDDTLFFKSIAINAGLTPV
jgi:hypothetical protein